VFVSSFDNELPFGLSAIHRHRVHEQKTVEDIVGAMLKLHGDRDNPRVLWHAARAALDKRG